MKVGILAGGVGLKWICLGPWLCKKTKLYPSMVTPIWIKSCFIVIWNVISHLMSELCFYMQNTPTLGYCRHGEGGDMLQWDVTFKGPKGLLRSWYEIRQIWNMKFSSHVLLLAHCAMAPAECPVNRVRALSKTFLFCKALEGVVTRQWSMTDRGRTRLM